MKCAVCTEEITPREEPDRVVFTDSAGTDVSIHERCWDRLGLEHTSAFVAEAAIVYAEAMRQPTFFQAVDVLSTAFDGAERSLPREAVLYRLAVCYGRDGGRNDA